MSEGADLQARAGKWRDDLASWAIPAEILRQAPEEPWIHPVAMFTVDDEIPDSPSHDRARQALPVSGSVLDVGCGGGRAAMALVPPAGQVIGVDHQAGMLEAFAAAADRRGVQHLEILGNWDEVQQEVPACDVVVCHHVVYNVADIVPFIEALDRHARRRVVLELPVTHPLTSLNPLWKRLWDLDRPTAPVAQDLCAIVEAMGLAPHLETWVDHTWGKRVELPAEERVRYARIRLCLPPERDADVAAALIAEADAQPHEVATLWWDASGQSGTRDAT
ncbi:MAG: methyltransferase domain-containing protein [Actinomycetales bacterium]|nr:methyltransferase domain-containing protein [Actinomycetales bacterium]